MTTFSNRAAVAMLAALVLLALSVTPALLAQERLDPGDVTLDLGHRSIVLEAGDLNADVDVAVINNTTRLVEFRIEVSGTPVGWKVDLWDRLFDYRVSSIALKSAERQDLRLRVQPPSDLAEDASHPLIIRLAALDGREIDKADFSVRALPSKSKEPGTVAVASTYPVLRGTGGNLFGFELDIRNKTGGKASFNLNAESPPSWQVEFVPAFGESKRISSLSMIENDNQRVQVRVTPPATAAVGDYPILVTVGNEQTESITTLLVTLIGKGVASVTTGSGRLNVSVTAGDASLVIFRIGNTGTAELRDLQLTAEAPLNWEVQYNLNPVPLLPTNSVIDITAAVVPDPDVLPGDYLVKLRAQNSQTDASLDLRVTVGRSTIWGWVGIGLVLLVLAGLGGLFWRLGRR